MKLLIAYDGSADAKAAVALAGHLFDGSTAVVLTVWDGLAEVVTRASGGVASTFDFDEINAQCAHRAEERAAEGAGLARAAGLQAETRVAERQDSIARAILHEADAADADMIVVGSRGLSGVKSLLLGSVSRAVLQRASRPVLVAPSAARRPEKPAVDTPFLSARL
jgi:nucleotide-binding universal stress UspA family protein